MRCHSNDVRAKLTTTDATSHTKRNEFVCFFLRYVRCRIGNKNGGTHTHTHGVASHSGAARSTTADWSRELGKTPSAAARGASPTRLAIRAYAKGSYVGHERFDKPRFGQQSPSRRIVRCVCVCSPVFLPRAVISHDTRPLSPALTGMLISLSLHLFRLQACR